jgi:hypothetical protein
MTGEERVQLFWQCVAAVDALEVEYPGDPTLQSIRGQLRFLIKQAAGDPRDQDGLDRINIGVLTVRQVEDMNDDVAQLLHRASGEAKRMRSEA